MNKSRSPQNAWLRPAILIHKQYQTAEGDEPLPELPTTLWRELKRLQRQQASAIAHGWLLTAARLKREFLLKLNQIHHAVTTLRDALNRPQSIPVTPALPELLADLAVLDNDFMAVAFDRSTVELSVTTEPVTLQELELGPFQIQLRCRELQTDQSSPYRVVALEPNPAASNDEVTHPHVQCESLCEGDGKQAIAAALAQGRLHDFFVIVANLLRTYNEGSPYVSLDDWFGANCDDCSDLQNSDGIVCCGQCDRGICVDCIDRCADCDESTCSGCLETCSTCPDACCPSCLSTCVDCETTCCPSCLSDSERCPDCHEAHEDFKEAEEDFETIPEIATGNSPAPQTGVAIQSDCLGEMKWTPIFGPPVKREKMCFER